MGLSDESLLAGLGSNDPQAATAFVRRFQGRVFGLAYTVLGDRDAAAIVVAALVSGGAVYRAQGPDRELAASVRATLATAQGQYFATGSLPDPRGEQRGIVFGYQGDPAWIFVTVAAPPAGRYVVEVVTHAGVVHVLARDVDLAATGSWGGIIPVAVHEISVVRVLDAGGRPTFLGRLVLR